MYYTNPQLPCFLDPMSSLGYKTLCIVISFRVLSSIYLRSSLVHFKNGTEYLTRVTTLAFISLLRFLLQRLVKKGFLVLLCYFFIPSVWWCPLPTFPNNSNYRSPVLLVPWGILSVLPKTVCGIQASNIFLLLLVRLEFIYPFGLSVIFYFQILLQNCVISFASGCSFVHMQSPPTC